jgi:hypothetical protein
MFSQHAAKKFSLNENSWYETIITSTTPIKLENSDTSKRLEEA